LLEGDFLIRYLVTINECQLELLLMDQTKLVWRTLVLQHVFGVSEFVRLLCVCAVLRHNAVQSVLNSRPPCLCRPFCLLVWLIEL